MATSSNGAPLEVRLPFELATWLALGLLTVNTEVSERFVYMYVVGAERLGAALDVVLAGYNNTDPVAPSVLRCHIIALAATLRGTNLAAFTATAPCLMLVGGNHDNLECGALTPPVPTLPLTPSWVAHIKFGDLTAPDGTLLLLAELEGVWAPRWLPSQRSAGGGIARWAMLLLNSMPTEAQVIISACTEEEQAEQFVSFTSTLLPTAPRLASYAPSGAAAALALSRTLARATSKEGPLSITVHEVLTAIPHFEFARLAIGTEMGAPTALGELLELVRAALKSNTAVLTLSSIAAAAARWRRARGVAQFGVRLHHRPLRPGAH
jgi:hypothetical protein